MYMQFMDIDGLSHVVDLTCVRNTIAHRGKPGVLVLKGEYPSVYNVDHDELQRVNAALVAMNTPAAMTAPALPHSIVEAFDSAVVLLNSHPSDSEIDQALSLVFDAVKAAIGKLGEK
jgi:hypothetical protein